MAGFSLITCRESRVVKMIIAETIVHWKLDIVVSVIGEHIYSVIR